VQQFRAAQPPVTEAAPEENAEIHETVKSIEETVAKVADQPDSDLRPVFAPAVAEDELPTKAFHIVTDPADDVEKTTLFSLSGIK